MSAEVSVIIPNLNSPLVGEVVRAVWEQRSPGLELEVIVAGLDQLGLTQRYPARYVTTGQALTPGAARNLGVAASTGDYLIFLDSDCLPEPHWLAGLLAYRNQGGRLVVSGAIKVVSDSFARVAGNLAAFREHTASLPAADRPFLASFCLAMPRQAFSDVGWFDEGLPRAEDLDFTIRLARAGYRLRFDPSIVVVHRPTRLTLGSLIRHAADSGRNSIRVRARYPGAFEAPRWLLHWPLLVGLGPLIALVVTAQAARVNPDIRAHPLALPLIYASRLAWCLGAAAALRRQHQHPADLR
jgi:glycosyltransferase involved in cell wall biosynthesis